MRVRQRAHVAIGTKAAWVSVGRYQPFPLLPEAAVSDPVGMVMGEPVRVYCGRSVMSAAANDGLMVVTGHGYD